MEFSQLELFSDAPEAHDSGCRRFVKWQPDIHTAVEFSEPDRVYRYRLVQRWAFGPMRLYVMMNPSGADVNVGDMTVAKTAKMARMQGFGGQMIANVCAYRATDNKRLLEVDDPVGPENEKIILEMAKEASQIVIAHGKLPNGLQSHAHRLVAKLREAGYPLYVLRLAKDGTPMHPLARGVGFIPLETTPRLWA